MARTTDPDNSSIEALEREAVELVLPRFDLADAWRLGSTIAARALAEDHPVAVDVRRPGGFVVFRAALPGSKPDQDHWIQRKAATALRLESSTLLLRERFRDLDLDPAEIGWLPRDDYVLAGGSIPVVVRDVGVVAAATVSGLTDEQDHALVADGIRGLLRAPR